MPYKDATVRLKAVAASVRKHRNTERLFLAAVAAGNPKALEAERQRELAENPMGPVHEFEARLMALSKPERQPFRAEHAALVRRCQAVDIKAARARYLALRDEAIAEFELHKLFL